MKNQKGIYYMKWDIHELSQKLNATTKKLEEEEILLNKIQDDLIQKVKKNNEEEEFQKVNRAYQQYISQFSKEYIEMSDYYYGPTLPYEIYCKEFKKGYIENSTYLDNPNDVQELYKLFIFYMMVDFYTRNADHF